MVDAFLTGKIKHFYVKPVFDPAEDKNLADKLQNGYKVTYAPIDTISV